MYYNIEKEYKKNNPNRAFDLFYWISSISLAIIVICLELIGLNGWYLLATFFIILILLIILYTIVDSKKYLVNQKNVKGVKKRLKLYIDTIDNINIMNLVDILKSNNITTKDKLNQCILHYRKKCSNEIKNSFWGNVITLIITLASFMVVGYDEELRVIDYEKLSVALSSAIGIIIFMYIIIYDLKCFIDGILVPKDKLYDELEDNLTYVYMNFDKYFKNIDKKESVFKRYFDNIINFFRG